MMSAFVLDCCIQRHRAYKKMWIEVYVGEPPSVRETRNSNDLYAVYRCAGKRYDCTHEHIQMCINRHFS